MKIDVIIPTFNRASYIEKSVQSVLSQSYENFHLYVVDDGSTDETQEVLKKFETHPKISLLKQKNQGVSGARNFAVSQGKNEWISFLDSDDEWLPTKLALQVSFLSQHSYSFLHAEEIWIRNGVRVNPKIKHSKSGPDIFKRSLEFCLISPSTVLMKRDLFHKHQGFDESLTVCEDFDLWNKILATEEVGFLDEFVTKKYGGHSDQLSTQYVAMDYWRIKSLVNLYHSNISGEKKAMILEEIKRKVPILLKGYVKHGNLEKHQEIEELTLKLK